MSEISQPVFGKVIQNSIFVIKLVSISLNLVVFMKHWGVLFMNIIAHDAEYFLALPYHLPLCEPHDFFTFFFNWFQQMLGALQEVCLFILILNYFYVFILHLLHQSNSITIFISKMKIISQETSFNNWLQIVIDSTEDVKQ